MNRIEIKGWGCFLALVFALFSFFLSLPITYTIGCRNGFKMAENSLKREVAIKPDECKNCKENKIEWDDFIRALIWVESKDDCNAIGNLDDVGVLQIRKVIVDDCNRILGYDKYSYEDRKDSLLSVEMFNVIQEYYNPNKDMHFALKLWNSKAPISYHKKVFKKIEEFNNTLLQE